MRKRTSSTGTSKSRLNRAGPMGVKHNQLTGSYEGKLYHAQHTSWADTSTEHVVPSYRCFLFCPAFRPKRNQTNRTFLAARSSAEESGRLTLATSPHHDSPSQQNSSSVSLDSIGRQVSHHPLQAPLGRIQVRPPSFVSLREVRTRVGADVTDHIFHALVSRGTVLASCPDWQGLIPMDRGCLSAQPCFFFRRGCRPRSTADFNHLQP